MNAIYSLGFMLFLFLGTTFGKTFMINHDVIIGFTVFQWIWVIIGIIICLVSFFINIDAKQEFKEKINKLKKYKKILAAEEESYNLLLEKYQKYIAEQYPSFEKEIFLKISENQPKELIALLQTYPELKSSTVLSQMMQMITNSINTITNKKHEVSRVEEELDNYSVNGWYFQTFKYE